MPTDGTIFGVVQNRPNTGLGLDEGLISIRIVLGHEVVDGGVLVEVVGGVGFAFGGGAIADVVVIVGDLVGGDEFIADVVAVLLVVLRGAAAKDIIGVDVRGIGGVGDGGEEVAVGFVTPCDHGVIGIGEFRLEVGAREVVPRKAVRFGDAARGGVIGDGLLAIAIHGVAHIATEGIPMKGEGFIAL